MITTAVMIIIISIITTVMKLSNIYIYLY